MPMTCAISCRYNRLPRAGSLEGGDIGGIKVHCEPVSRVEVGSSEGVLPVSQDQQSLKCRPRRL